MVEPVEPPARFPIEVYGNLQDASASAKAQSFWGSLVCSICIIFSPVEHCRMMLHRKAMGST